MLKFYLSGRVKQLCVSLANSNSINRSKKTAALVAFSFMLHSAAFGQGPESKIDPSFRYLISQEKSRDLSPRSYPSKTLLQPTEGFASRGGQKELRYNCIVYTTNGRSLRDSGLVINSVLPRFATAWVTLDQIERMARMPQVSYIEAPHEDQLHNDVSTGSSGASLLHAGRLNNTPYKGKGVIVAVYDSGIDWDHPDFRNPADPTKSRILRIWDQTITAGTGEAPPAGFSYGVEYTQAQINDELDGSPANFVRETDINGHGTHVAGTAAGNGSAIASNKYSGLAPEADIIIIKGGNGSFPVTNTVDAITYLKGLANTLGKPIVLNMSIGGQSGPHDGSMVHELAVDDFTSSGPGRVVVISAGNDNGTAIHTRTVLAAGASANISFTVPAGTTGTDVFQFSTYAFTTGTVTATATAPTGEVSPAATPGTVTYVDGVTNNFRAYVTNDLYSTNGKRYINFYVTRNGSNTGSPAGTWTLTITNTSGTTMTFDGWLNYRNTVFANTALVGGDNNHLVGTPGNATSAITTASYVGKLKWYSAAVNGTYTYNAPTQQDNISTFSAQGPRRDGVQKPEIAAHGQAVISVLSSNAPSASTDAAVTGLYQRMQGTSQAAPSVTGAAALLLQASPSATAFQVKSWLTAAANSDGLTGSVPNGYWGYGRLDVFKAMTSVFNCTPAARSTYQYDNSMTASTDGLGVTQGTGRVAVRFTSDMNGKVGGIFYHASATIADMVVEIRANSGGIPGALLGTQNVALNNLAIGAFNYIDLSGMNVSVANGTDYFVVIYRNPSSSANWSVRYDNSTTSTRSFTSADGNTWTPQAYNWRIRTVVYNNGQLSGNIVTSNATDTRNINTSNQFLNSCRLIAQLVPSGANPVSGTVTTRAWIESSVPKYGARPYVARHYEITPAIGTSTATGRVTLYFTQAEFNAFNADPGTPADLPANSGDAAGKANLRVVKFPGTSSDGSGLPSSYSSGPVTIDPADGDIVWSAEFNRWEVSFDVTGFSGFIVMTNTIALPVTIESFTGVRRAQDNLLRWKANCVNTGNVQFEIQRSANGRDFTTIGTVSAAQGDCSRGFEFPDANFLVGQNYYRLRIVEDNGQVKYTGIILLTGEAITSVYPSVLPKGASLQVNYGGIKGSIVLTDDLGRTVYTQNLAQGAQMLTLPVSATGVYYYRVLNEESVQVLTGKIMIQ